MVLPSPEARREASWQGWECVEDFLEAISGGMDCQGPTGKYLAWISNEAVKIAQTEFHRHQPDVVVGSSRGGAVAMNINSGEARLVLLGPAGKKWGTAKTVKAGTVILHSRTDYVVPFAYSEEMVHTSGLPTSALVEVGSDHRLADSEPLRAMLEACERAAATRRR